MKSEWGLRAARAHEIWLRLYRLPLRLRPPPQYTPLTGNEVCTFLFGDIAITDSAGIACHLPSVPAFVHTYVGFGR